MKFAHIADTHIRNLKYHNEYRTIFNKIYGTLKDEQVDYIIHCGDICHTKTQISPEFVQMCSDFFKSLAKIAPTYIILGNHDGNLKNQNRQDALSPIVSALGNPNLHLLKNSGEIHLDDKFSLNSLSVFDQDNWVQPTNKEKVNIALYHGSVSGCKTDAGWTIDIGEHDISIFDKFDYAMLGDIHLTNQIMDANGRIRYAGSTIQQNHGEGTCKGFLLWDIENKENFTCKPITLTNPKPFISLPLTAEGKVPELKLPESTRLRIIVENSISATALKKAVDVAKKRFNPESITVVNKSTFTNGVTIDDNFKKENLRDIGVQENLICDYLKDYKINDKLEKKIKDLNKKYKQIAEETEEVYRNVDFEILELEWDNLFNYGKDNRINFTNFTGITGIFGRNFSGKSSIIDSLLYTIYNSISKNSRKNLNIINNDKTEGWGQVKIRCGNKVYTIKRQSEKYLKRLKGEETVEAKTVVDFSCIDVATGNEESLNGLTRSDTDKNIIKYFGTIDDFLLTSMSSQLGALTFINEGSTKRKEILAKFLDLEIFDKKFKVAKDDAADLKSAIRILEKNDYEEEIKKYKKELFDNEVTTLKKKNNCECYRGDIIVAQKEIRDLEDKIASAPTEVINIVNIKNSISQNKKKLLTYEKEIDVKIKENRRNKNKILNANEFIKDFNIDEPREQKTLFEMHEADLEVETSELFIHNEKIERLEKQIELLSEVPCGSEYSHCKFIRGAYESKNELQLVQLGVEITKERMNYSSSKLSEIEIGKVTGEIEKYDKFLEIKKDLENKIPTQELYVENLDSKKSVLAHELKDLQEREKLYENNKEVIEDLESIVMDKNSKISYVKNIESQLEVCESGLLELYKMHGYYEQKLENLETEKNKFDKLSDDYEAHDLYMKCMHPNGIAYDIIKKSLPTINGEISKILANIVDFQVYFETDDNRLDIYLQQPDRDASPLEMASGAEKTVAAMAIRLAFTNISSLPKSQLFILDEPGTALDEERMEGFVRILDITASIFKTVILISHLDNLKDAADSIISIEKKGDYAHVVA